MELLVEINGSIFIAGSLNLLELFFGIDTSLGQHSCYPVCCSCWRALLTQAPEAMHPVGTVLFKPCSMNTLALSVHHDSCSPRTNSLHACRVECSPQELPMLICLSSKPLSIDLAVLFPLIPKREFDMCREECHFDLIAQIIVFLPVLAKLNWNFIERNGPQISSQRHQSGDFYPHSG